jgi:hypothetical protein
MNVGHACWNWKISGARSGRDAIVTISTTRIEADAIAWVRQIYIADVRNGRSAEGADER